MAQRDPTIDQREPAQTSFTFAVALGAVLITEEARLPAVTLAVFPLGALVALARSGSELGGATAIMVYIAGLSGWFAAAVVLWADTRPGGVDSMARV